jgi:hypothetical protein
MFELVDAVALEDKATDYVFYHDGNGDSCDPADPGKLSHLSFKRNYAKVFIFT